MPKSEDMSSTEIIDKFVNEFIGFIPILKVIQDFFTKIINIIPNSLSAINTIHRLFIFNAIELILLVISIALINNYAPTNILQPSTPEGTIFIVFLIFLFFNVLHTSYLYLYKTDVTGFTKTIKDIVHSIPMFIIVFVFSLILWFLMNIFGWIQLLFSTIFGGFATAIEVLTKMLRNPDEASTVYKYGALYSVILIVLVILYLAAFDPNAISKDMVKYSFAIIIPLVLVILFVIPLIKKQGSSTHLIFFGMFITFFVALFYFYSKGDTKTNNVINYLTLLATVAMVIGGLAIAFYTLSNYLKTLTGWSGFFVYLIFYIPCLFIDFIRYILNEFKMTSSTIYVLLIFEIVVILLYFYLPWLIEKMKKRNKVILLPKSAFLDIEQTIGNSEMNKKTEIANTLGSQEIVYNQNYALSMWIYLNPQPSNNVGYASESQIFNYGDGKPRITYYNDISSEGNDYGHSGVDKYKIYFTNSSAPKGYYEFTLPSQKWNNITVNFSSPQADLFINGKLFYSYIYKGNPPTYAPTDYVTIGQNRGLDGAICNVIYYPNNLSLIEITNHYNLYMMKNPPY